MARTECLGALGLSVTELESDGVFLPVVHCSCEYHLGARFEDQLDVISMINAKPRSTLRIDYEIIRKKDNKRLVTGYTLHAFINREGIAVRPPKSFIQAISTALTS